jgi:hypothetical protein
MNLKEFLFGTETERINEYLLSLPYDDFYGEFLKYYNPFPREGGICHRTYAVELEHLMRNPKKDFS